MGISVRLHLLVSALTLSLSGCATQKTSSHSENSDPLKIVELSETSKAGFLQRAPMSQTSKHATLYTLMNMIPAQLPVTEFGTPMDLRNIQAVQPSIFIFLDKVDAMLGAIENPEQMKSLKGQPKNWPQYLFDRELISEKKLKDGLKKIESLGKIVKDDFAHATFTWKTHHLIGQIYDIHRTLVLTTVYPIPKKQDAIVPIKRIIDESFQTDVSSNPVGGSRNLESKAGVNDPSLLDPVLSTLWKRPIERKNLVWGFDRTGPVFDGKAQCTYKEPKTNYGTHPGMTLDCAGEEIKIKFEGELYTEPFASRIFWALGYNVEPVDSITGVTIKYDRRYFTEYNMRRKIGTDVTVFGIIPVGKFKVREYWDPFNSLAGAILKPDSPAAKKFKRTEISVRELKSFILKEVWPRNSESVKNNFIESNEDQIESLVTVPTQIQGDVKGLTKLGPWSWNEMNRKTLREYRGVTALALWLNWYDARFDNNRLALRKNGDEKEVAHYISDLGSLLGKAEGLVNHTSGVVNDFDWRFSSSNKQGDFLLKNFQNLEENETFQAMTVTDAKWMARLIAELTYEQIQQALVGAGFSSAEVALYTQKLLSRRYWMLHDLGLLKEYPEFKAQKPNENYNYDPRKHGKISAVDSTGKIIRAFREGGYVRNGKFYAR